MLIKLIIAIMFVAIVFNLARALYLLLKASNQGTSRMVKALTWRISLSLGLFILIIIAYLCGLITPNQIKI